MKTRINQLPALGLAAVAMLTLLNAPLSTAFADTNRVGVLTVNYSMGADGSGQFDYSGTWYDGDYSGPALWAGYDALSLSISGQVKYEVLRTSNNLIVGKSLNSSASETALGNEHTHYMGEQLNGFENPPSEEDDPFDEAFVGDSDLGNLYSYPSNVCVMLANSPDGSGQFLGTCGKALYGSPNPDGSFGALNYPWKDDCTPWSGDDSLGPIEGQYCALRAQDEVRHFQFAITNCAMHWSQTVATNSTANNAFSVPGEGSESGNASGWNTVTLEYIPDQLTVPFTATPTNGLVPLTVEFSAEDVDSTSNTAISTWYWYFGDGSTGTGQTSTHTYTNAGTNLVTLLATNVNGTAVQGIGSSNIVVSLPTVQFTAWPTNGYLPLTVAFNCTNADSGFNPLVSWTWQFGDNSAATGQEQLHTYTGTNSKTFSPKLTVQNFRGTVIVATGPKITAVYPPILFTASPTHGRIPMRVQFSAPGADVMGVAITNWSWKFGDGATNAAQNPAHTYTNTGIFQVTLSAKNTNGTAVVGFGPNISAGCSEVYTFGISGGGVAFDPSSAAFTNSDGIHPQAGLAAAGGRLYGVMSGGGNGGSGTVFALSPDGTGFSNLYSFSPLAMGWYTNVDGAWPRARLVAGGDTLYGAAPAGGTNMMGCGTVFRINTDGSAFTNLHNFSYSDICGVNPNGLVLSGNTLYGTAGSGGSNDNGTLFKLDTDGSGFVVLYDFSASGWNPASGNETNGDGAYPAAALLLTGNDLVGKTLYGTASQGGLGGGGTVFRVGADGRDFTVLHPFTNIDGASPQGELLLSGFTLYGTTAGGGSAGNGTVFKVNTDGSGFTTLHSFSAGTYDTSNSVYINGDGAKPSAGLLLSGATLYGTAQNGGTGGSGTIFSINTDGTCFTNLYSFSAVSYNSDLGASTNLDGANPSSGLVLSNDYVYGTACNGGSAGRGAVMALSVVAAAPPLGIQISGHSLVIAWPSSETGWTLQQCGDLAAGDWCPCNLTVGDDGIYKSVTVTPATASQFFRLAK